MSDSLASNATLVAPSEGQAQAASEVKPQSGTGGQPSTDGQAAQKNNVAEIQRIKDKEINTLRQNFEAQQRQRDQMIQQLQQRLNQMEDAAAPDDYSRAELQIRRLQQERDQYATAYQQTIQEREAETARSRALREVADEFGVSVKDLEEATDYMSAVKLAVKAQRTAEQRKQEQQDDKRERNTVDIGGGIARTTESEWEQNYRDAGPTGKRDSAALMRLHRTRGKTP